MSFINKIRKNILYAFIALPLLLISYEGFMSVAIGSTGWLTLFLGQIIAVPLVAAAISVYNFTYTSIVGFIFVLVVSLVPIGIWGWYYGSYARVPSMPTLQLTTTVDNQTTFTGFAIFGILALFLIPLAYYSGVKYPINIIKRSITFPWDIIKSFFTNNQQIPSSDICNIIPGSITPVTRIPSYYLAHVAYFIGYIVTNAIMIYRIPKDKNKNINEESYDNRRNRALMTIMIPCVFYILLVYYRSTLTNCESAFGIFSTTSIFVFLGFCLYHLAEACGAGKSDILGIYNTILQEGSKQKPIVCAGVSGEQAAPQQ